MLCQPVPKVVLNILRWPAVCEARGGWELIELEEAAVFEMRKLTSQ